MEKLIKTQFDGRKALIKKPHPHFDNIAECLGVEYTHSGFALRFKNCNDGEEYFLFNPKELEWIKE